MTERQAHRPRPGPDRRTLVVRALRRYRSRLARKLEALRGDLAEAKRAPEHRRAGEALLAYLHRVPVRASNVSLPDPADPERTIEIELDPAIKPQANAARYFKRAAKGERGLAQIPPRIAAAEDELRELDELLERASAAEATGRPVPEAAEQELDAALELDLEQALTGLPPGLRGTLRPRAVRPSVARGRAHPAPHEPAAPRAEPRAPSARLQPRRLKSVEGWEVMIGRNNEGNDYLTHRLARPEDYWFHVHGASGSHVVLRRGKGKNEPSKRTIEEVAAWAAFYSQARTAGKVPVIVTRKKYVRKPRKGPPGLALCEREKTVMVRPAEPPREAMATVWGRETAGD